MSREEYMKQLSFLLQDIPENEREEALAYYEDYFEEAGEGQERQVAATLGSPEKVAAMIKEGLAGEIRMPVNIRNPATGTNGSVSTIKYLSPEIPIKTGAPMMTQKTILGTEWDGRRLPGAQGQ